jgi:condensin complex subunit 3
MLAPLLAKLHISSASTESLLREVYQEVCDAIEEKVISDAAGRNALYKIHVSLGKIVNNMSGKVANGRKSSVPLAEGMIAEGDEEESEGKTENIKAEEEDMNILDGESKLTRDSLVEDLLSDDDATMT